MDRETDFTKLSVIVVDSNNHTLKITRNVLRALGISGTRAATDALKALELMGVTSFDLAIIDLEFKDCLNGVEIVEVVRTGDQIANPKIPIVMISSAPQQSQVMAARDAGVHEFLRRPFSATELRGRICSALKRERGFIKSSGYKGPDRRRTNRSEYKGPDRRQRDGEKALKDGEAVEVS